MRVLQYSSLRLFCYAVTVCIVASVENGKCSSQYIVKRLLSLFKNYLVLFTLLDKVVSCGSAVKLSHIESGNKHYLYSPATNWSQGSNQRSVTLAKDNGPGSLWLVKEAHGMTECMAGEPIKCGQQIRLENLDAKGQNLHSHDFRSPLSSQQEISVYGTSGNGDDGDNWYLICDNKYWQKDMTIKLKHVHTAKYLGASRKIGFNDANCGMGCPILGHLEVCGMRGFEPDKRTEFRATKGLFVLDE